MSDHAHAHDSHDGGAHGAHGPAHYIKIWAILLVLLIISVLGPFLGHPIVTLVTAFGIALVKAYLVAKNFMHINIEKSYIHYILVTALVFMLLFFAGVSPDVMRHEGHQWSNNAAKAAVEKGIAAHNAAAAGHNAEGGEHAAPHH